MVYVVQIAFLDIIVTKQSKNGVNLSMLSRQLIGAKFLLTRRYLLEILKMKNGVIDTKKYRYGGVFSFINGATSWSAENNEDCVWWKYAKLAEPNNT